MRPLKQKTRLSDDDTVASRPTLLTYEIILGDKTKVETDARSKARFTRLPFEFPNNERGLIVLLKPNDPIWKPQKEITSVVINFK